MTRLAATAAVAALAISAPAAGGLLFSTLAKGTTRQTASGAAVADTRAKAARLAARLRPADRQAVTAVDFRRYVVAAAFVRLPTPCHAFDVADVSRRRGALVVAVVVGGQHGICTQVVSTGYQVVELRRAALGRSVPRRATLRVARFR